MPHAAKHRSNRKPILVLFRKDLRLRDNPAFWQAAKEKKPMIPVFIWDAQSKNPWQPGEASRWMLGRALKHLQAELNAEGLKLILRKGDYEKELLRIARETEAREVFLNRVYEPWHMLQDEKMKSRLDKKKIGARFFNASLLFEPASVKNKTGQPYKVYTAFWNQISVMPVEKPLGLPGVSQRPDQWPFSESMEALKIDAQLKWAHKFENYWPADERERRRRVQKFLNNKIQNYGVERDRPDHEGTSKLSPFLTWGEISVRELWHQIKSSPWALVFRKQLVWREFAYHLLSHFPHTDKKPLRQEFEKFPWTKDRRLLARWQKGQTGYPIVDAGMRELWETGWMHNRVRMITASFLIKDLGIHWLEGAKWFWDTLADADLANNTMGWQWVAGSGADAAPFFRIFNPVLQGEKFDPLGCYVKKWVPELKDLPEKWIHKPWQAPQDVLVKAGVRIGGDYSRPVVDHDYRRKMTLMRYYKFKDKF